MGKILLQTFSRGSQIIFFGKSERLLEKDEGIAVEIDSNTVKQAIMRMKNRRAAGPGDVPIG
jgi:hypothetical protein